MMLLSERSPSTLWPPETTSGEEDYERLERALERLVKDHGINDFIKRLHYTVEDIVRKKAKPSACDGRVLHPSNETR